MVQIIKAIKSLGQNFLQDSSVIENIVSMSGASDETDVIEIGPGMGAVTDLLIEQSKSLTAIEIDTRLFNELSRRYERNPNFKIINTDVLKTDLSPYITDNTIVVANLPYYITTPIITMLIESELKLKSMTVMVQLEVAKRICADEKSKDYGAISVLCNYFCDTELLFIVPPEAFSPVPKVHSAVIKLNFRDVPKVLPQNEGHFFKVVKAAFSNRRKTFVNCLMQYFTMAREEAVQILSCCDINLMARGETLSLEKFKDISDYMCSKTK